MTAWFERRPGSEETLLALYDVVQAAEELDLKEQADKETARAEFVEGDDSVEDSPIVEKAADDPRERPSMSQAVGIIEHLLGGQTLP